MSSCFGFFEQIMVQITKKTSEFNKTRLRNWSSCKENIIAEEIYTQTSLFKKSIHKHRK